MRWLLWPQFPEHLHCIFTNDNPGVEIGLRRGKADNLPESAGDTGDPCDAAAACSNLGLGLPTLASRPM